MKNLTLWIKIFCIAATLTSFSHSIFIVFFIGMFSCQFFRPVLALLNLTVKVNVLILDMLILNLYGIIIQNRVFR